MEQYSMRSIRYSRSSDRGFSILELLVASTLGFVVTGLALTTSIFTRNTLGRDMVRTRINQNVRGALTILLNDGRIAGENLGPAFPVIEIEDGGAGSDQLVMRRNLLDEVLPVCTTVTAGAVTNKVDFAIPGNVAGCVYASHTQDFNVWKAYRLAHNNVADAFIYNATTKTGEFFSYNGESDNGSTYSVRTDPTRFNQTYPAGASAVYMLVEWRYRLLDDTLQVIENRRPQDAFNVAFNLSRFNVQTLLQDGTTHTLYTKDDSWTGIDRVEVSITGTESFAKQPMNRTLVGRFFPRNILSN